MRRPAPSTSDSANPRSTAAALLACALLFAGGCGEGVWPEREGAETENIRVDTVRAFPAGSRFILRDSAAGVLFSGYHIGYSCSRVLEMALDSSATGNLPTFGPRTRVRLPATPDCPVDQRGRDTVLTRVFGAGLDTVLFANSSGAITDTAIVVSGTMAFDTLKGVPDSVTHSFRSGIWTFSDSTSAGRYLSADSLSACSFLNYAEHTRPSGYAKGDTVTVRLTLITVDSAAVAGGCGGTRSDYFQPFPALR